MTRNDDGGTGSEDDPTLDHDTHWRQVAQRHYDPDEDGELTTVLVFAIAEARDVSPDEVKSPPLYAVADVPAIEAALFNSETETESRQGTVTIKFRYADYLVKTRSDGWIQVYETTEPDRV
ncbi:MULTISPECIES: HalOD1 output domain-containing protein [Salinibaculum]|uniref:HalOD1 output domain-containing protein n=1 Tax=Salinibaculum TaxID=2732368 RepID=UPI0030CB50FA